MSSGEQSDADLANRLHSIAIHLLRRVRKEDSATGLSPSRLSALSVVGFGGPLSLGELAAAEQVRAPTMSRIVAALEESGIVERARDPADARRVLFKATPEGMRILLEGQRRRTAALERLLLNLTPEESAALRQTLAGLERLVGGAHSG